MVLFCHYCGKLCYHSHTVFFSSVCVCVGGGWVCTHVYGCPQKGFGSLGVGVTVLDHPSWVLGTKLNSTSRTTGTFICLALSLAPHTSFSKMKKEPRASSLLGKHSTKSYPQPLSHTWNIISSNLLDAIWNYWWRWSGHMQANKTDVSIVPIGPGFFKYCPRNSHIKIIETGNMYQARVSRVEARNLSLTSIPGNPYIIKSLGVSAPHCKPFKLLCLVSIFDNAYLLTGLIIPVK